MPPLNDAPREVAVENGGWLGGTGQVTRVTVQAGAGFDGSFDPRQWTVVMEGVEASPSLNVANRDGVLEARWAPGGTLVCVH